MAVEEKNATYKVKWQAVNSNMKSQEIDLEEGIKVCFGVKNNLFHHMIYLVSKCCQPSASEISEVYCASCNFPDQRKQMTLVTTEGPTCVFSAEVVEWKSPLTLTFWVSLKVKDSMPDFRHQLVDSQLSNQLWVAAKRAQFTDIEFRIGQPLKQKVFNAHRSVLAARSVIFAGQFEKESSLNSIVIEDVHHAVFKQFLRFIYTGQLKATSTTNMSELLTLADRYQVAALQSLCRSPLNEMNASELTSLIISLNNPSISSRADSFSNKPTGLRSTQASPTAASEAVFHASGSFQEPLSLQQGQVRLSPSIQERSNIFGVSGPISTSTNFNYSFAKPNTSSGPMSFCIPNAGSPAVVASPVTGRSALFTCVSPTNPNGTSSTPTGKARSHQTAVNTSTPAEGPAQFKPLFRTVSAGATIGRITEKATGSRDLSLKASVVANAVNQLRLIFDEMLGEASIVSSSPESSQHSVHPPMANSGSQKRTFALMPSRLNTSSSGSPSLGPPAASGFAFPSVTKEGKFGKVPLKSPSVGLPWKPERLSDGQPNSAIGSLSVSAHTSLMDTSALDSATSLSNTLNESIENSSKPLDPKYRADVVHPPQEVSELGNSSSLRREMLRNAMMDNSTTTTVSIL